MPLNPNCTLCGLCENSPKVCVGGMGPSKATVMVVMDYPSVKEARTGKLMQGEGGQLLMTQLAENGIDPKKVYFTPLIKCVVPYKAKVKGDQIKACRPYLEEEIETVNPDWVVLCGATPLKFIRKSGIMEQHTKVHEIGGRKFFTMASPSIAIRDPSKAPMVKLAVAKLCQLIEGTYEEPEEIDWALVTPETLDQVIREFKGSKYFSFDVETTGLLQQDPTFRVNSIAITLESRFTWVLPLFKNPDRKWARSVIQQLGRMANEGGYKGVAHNGKFDNNSLFARYGFRFPLAYDTMLASHVLDENSPHDLKFQAKIHCGAPDYDDLTLAQKKGGLKGESLTRLYRYNAMDTYYTTLLRRYQVQKLKGSNRLRRLFYNLVMPAARAFEEIDYHGHYIDLEMMDQVRATTVKKIAALNEEMQRMTGTRKIINFGSPAQVADLFYRRLGMPCTQFTPEGKPSTSESALLDLQHEYPLAAKLLEWRGLNKHLNTYLDGLKPLMVGNMLYLSTKLHGTVTGRYSSRLHQIPRDGTIRNIFTAPKGYKFFCADFSQIELRLVADASGDQRLTFIFQTGGDVHVETAKEAMGVIREPTKEERKAAKAINFGYVYGMGYKKFRLYAKEKYGVELTDAEAKSFRDRFFRLYSGLLPWHDRVRRRVREEGFMVYHSGRCRRLPGVFSSEGDAKAEAERQAINSPIQGFGSGDLKVMALLAVKEYLDANGYGVVVGEVHDSVLGWFREDVANEAAAQVKAIMENPPLLEIFGIELSVPLVVDIEVGGSWGAPEFKL